MSVSTRRLQKELSEIKTQGTPTGMSMPYHSGRRRAHAAVATGIALLSADDFQTWILSIEVLGDTVFEVCAAAIT